MRNARWPLFVVFIVLLVTSGCCTRPAGPCSACYDQVKTASYDLSPAVKQKLDGLNEGLRDRPPGDSVRLKICNDIMLRNNVVTEIADRTMKSCNAAGLSKEQGDDCRSPVCQARLKAEWCTGLSKVIGEHTSECGKFQYNEATCEYVEITAPK